MHASAAAPEILPATQSLQSAALALLAYLPGSQFVQLVSPPADIVPAEQSEHDDASLELGMVPATHAVQLVAPALLTDPAAHGVQLVDAALAAYVPLRQSVHASAAVPEILPASQSSQLLAPTLLAKVPGSQLAHVVDAAISAYVPLSPSDPVKLPVTHFISMALKALPPPSEEFRRVERPTDIAAPSHASSLPSVSSESLFLLLADITLHPLAKVNEAV